MLLRMKRAVLTSCIALAFLVPARGLAAGSDWLTFEARQWATEPSGTIRFNERSLAGALDLETDLGLDDDDSPEGRLVFRPSEKTMIRLGYLPEVALAGDNVISRSFEFLGETFDVNERVATDLDIEYGRLGFAWQVFSYGAVRFGPLLEVKGFRGTLGLFAPDRLIDISVSEEFEATFASAGLIAEVDLTRRIQLFGEATVLVESDEGDLTDSEYGLRFRVIPKVGILAGVRKIDIDIQKDDDTLDFEIEGIFLGVSVHF